MPLRRLFLSVLPLLLAAGARAQSSDDRSNVLKAILAHEISAGAPDAVARSRIVVDSVTAASCNDRVCDWYSAAAKLPVTVRSFVTDSLGAGVRDRDNTYFCDDVAAHYCQFVHNANAFLRVTEPVIRGDTALVGVNWYRSTRQPLAIAGQVSRLVRKAGSWVFDRITFEWM